MILNPKTLKTVPLEPKNNLPNFFNLALSGVELSEIVIKRQKGK
jgi:hypothetical protein